jgi:hypothetical protein
VKLKYYIMYIPVLFLLPGGPGSARSGSPGQGTCQGHADRDTLALLISGHEKMPPAGFMKPGDAALLKEIALSSCYPSFARGRALRVLGKVEGEAGVHFLLQVLKDDTKSYYLRIEAAHVLKNILGKDGPDRVARNLPPLLKSHDVRLRATALHILSELGTPLARSMIQDHGLVERHRSILELYPSN